MPFHETMKGALFLQHGASNRKKTKIMRIQTFVTGCSLALALFLFAQRHGSVTLPSGFHAVIDLTHEVGPKTPGFDPSEVFRAKIVNTIEKDKYFGRTISLPEHFGTHIDAPAHFAKGLWTVDQIPAERLVAPLVVLDVRSQLNGNADYLVSVEDIARWEKVNGHIPQGSVVVVRTGWASRWNSGKDYRNLDSKGVLHFPGYSLDTAKFLIEARNVIGLGIDTLSVDTGSSQDFPVHQYSLAHSVYHLENVANLEHVPPAGVVVVVAPMKLEGGSGGPVRILALVR
jgi:kynurenine formamidase